MEPITLWKWEYAADNCPKDLLFDDVIFIRLLFLVESGWGWCSCVFDWILRFDDVFVLPESPRGASISESLDESRCCLSSPMLK